MKTTDKDNNAVVSFLKRNALSIILIIGTGVYTIIMPILGKGAKAEFNESIIKACDDPAVKEKLTAEFERNLTDPTILGKVLESPTINDFTKDAGDKIRNTVIENVLSEDSSKISTVSYIGKETGMRDEDVLPKLAKLLQAWDKGELMTKDEADAYIEKKLRIARF